LFQIIWKNKNRVDLYFDAMKSVTDIRNKNILTFFKAVKYLLSLENFDDKKQELTDLQEELEYSIQS
jgi:hypothetical protein